MHDEATINNSLCLYKIYIIYYHIIDAHKIDAKQSTARNILHRSFLDYRTSN
jgi:hypothetical protein